MAGGSDYDRSDAGGHEWTEFEMNTLLALICKRVHKTEGGFLTLTSQLNEALNPGSGRYQHDIEFEEVRDMVVRLTKQKKAAFAFIDRQPLSRLTRIQKRVFARDLPFTGTLTEWETEGRKEAEEGLQPKPWPAPGVGVAEDERLSGLLSGRCLSALFLAALPASLFITLSLSGGLAVVTDAI